MQIVIDIDEDVRIAIDQMGLLRIPDEMQKKVDKAIQHGTPIEQEPKTDIDKIRAEIDAHREKLKSMSDDDWYAGKIRGYDCAIEIIDKYKAKSEE